jgi:hypothetical protein
MWKAFWPCPIPSLMNGNSTLYSSSGEWKNAQMCRYFPNGAPAKLTGWSAKLVPPLSASSKQSASYIDFIRE